MHIERLDHVNVQTHDLEATREFYVAMVGLSVGDRPPFNFPGYWLYDDRVAVIHLTGLTGDDPQFHGTGSVDHIAFRASGLAATRERLSDAGVTFEERIVPRTGELQIFLRDPNGVAIELTYAAAEATAARSREALAGSPAS